MVGGGAFTLIIFFSIVANPTELSRHVRHSCEHCTRTLLLSSEKHYDTETSILPRTIYDQKLSCGGVFFPPLSPSKPDLQQEPKPTRFVALKSFKTRNRGNCSHMEIIFNASPAFLSPPDNMSNKQGHPARH